MSRQGEENRQETKGQNLPALPCKNTPAIAGKQKPPRCAGSAHQLRTCLLVNKKLCTSKRVQTGTCGNTRTCMVPSVHVRCRFCECIQNLFPRMCTTYLRIDLASHWTLYNIVFHGMRFSAHRQLMSYLTSFLILLFSKIEHHVVSSSVPLSVRFAGVSSEPFLLQSRPQK